MSSNFWYVIDFVREYQGFYPNPNRPVVGSEEGKRAVYNIFKRMDRLNALNGSVYSLYSTHSDMAQMLKLERRKQLSLEVTWRQHELSNLQSTFDIFAWELQKTQETLEKMDEKAIVMQTEILGKRAELLKKQNEVVNGIPLVNINERVNEVSQVNQQFNLDAYTSEGIKANLEMSTLDLQIAEDSLRLHQVEREILHETYVLDKIKVNNYQINMTEEFFQGSVSNKNYVEVAQPVLMDSFTKIDDLGKIKADLILKINKNTDKLQEILKNTIIRDQKFNSFIVEMEKQLNVLKSECQRSLEVIKTYKQKSDLLLEHQERVQEQIANINEELKSILANIAEVEQNTNVISSGLDQVTKERDNFREQLEKFCEESIKAVEKHEKLSVEAQNAQQNYNEYKLDCQNFDYARRHLALRDKRIEVHKEIEAETLITEKLWNSWKVVCRQRGLPTIVIENLILNVSPTFQNSSDPVINLRWQIHIHATAKDNLVNKAKTLNEQSSNLFAESQRRLNILEDLKNLFNEKKQEAVFAFAKSNEIKEKINNLSTKTNQCEKMVNQLQTDLDLAKEKKQVLMQKWGVFLQTKMDNIVSEEAVAAEYNTAIEQIELASLQVINIKECYDKMFDFVPKFSAIEKDTVKKLQEVLALIKRITSINN